MNGTVKVILMISLWAIVFGGTYYSGLIGGLKTLILNINDYVFIYLTTELKVYLSLIVFLLLLKLYFIYIKNH